MKRFAVLVLVLCLCVGLCACGKPDEVVEVENLINKIGEVTIESGVEIDLAKTYYENLSAELQEKVENADILAQAVKTYEDMIHYDVAMEKFLLVSQKAGTKITTYSNTVFNDTGLMVEQTETKNNTSITFKYEYDEVGNIIKRWTDIGIEGWLTQDDYIYDANGMLICETRTSNIPGVNTYSKEYTNTVDTEGRITEKRVKSTDSKYITRHVYTYDNGGLIASEKISYDGIVNAYVLSKYRYDVYGNLIATDSESFPKGDLLEERYIYETVSEYTISSRTDSSLKTKDQWCNFEFKPDMPKLEDILTTAKLCKTEKSDAYSQFLTYVVSNTEDCGKYLNILEQECGFEITFFSEEYRNMGCIMDDGKEFATFVLQTQDDLGLVFILAFHA